MFTCRPYATTSELMSDILSLLRRGAQANRCPLRTSRSHLPRLMKFESRSSSKSDYDRQPCNSADKRPKRVYLGERHYPAVPESVTRKPRRICRFLPSISAQHGTTDLSLGWRMLVDSLAMRTPCRVTIPRALSPPSWATKVSHTRDLAPQVDPIRNMTAEPRPRFASLSISGRSS